MVSRWITIIPMGKRHDMRMKVHPGFSSEVNPKLPIVQGSRPSLWVVGLPTGIGIPTSTWESVPGMGWAIPGCQFWRLPDVQTLNNPKGTSCVTPESFEHHPRWTAINRNAIVAVFCQGPTSLQLNHSHIPQLSAIPLVFTAMAMAYAVSTTELQAGMHRIL